MAKLERCAICDELTGNAGVLDDSIVCVKCGKVICSECIDINYSNPVDEYEVRCTDCKAKF